jgi:hypothetical protein
MIELVGSPGTPEHDAAVQLSDVLEATWPGLRESPAEEDHVKIAAGVKLSGYRVSDIDVVIAARFSGKRYIVPKAVFLDADGKKVAGAKVRVRSFVAGIEVKDHDANRLRIDAGSVTVEYKDGWKSATDQNDQQRYALRDYLADRVAGDPWVYRCVLLRGIAKLPSNRGRPLPESGAVASSYSGAEFLMAMASVNGVRTVGGEYCISSGPDGLLDESLSASIFTAVVPSNLDRARMDRIAARPPLARELAGLLGEKRVHLRGEGGTGKTVLLLQAAAEAFQQECNRSIVLTYNHALAADIQRLLALMRIPGSGDNGGVDVRTVMSFCYAWFSRLGLIEQGEDLDFDDYEKKCLLALEYLRTGTVTAEDIETIKRQDPLQFGYDALLVDESQDWPQPEADLVCILYGGQSVSIVDGVTQLVRGEATDWRATIGGQKAAGFHHFRECLRMKSNLARFANEVAIRAGLNWSVEPSSEAAGGRVILLHRPYADCPDIRSRLTKLADETGNSPVDFLHCVPSSEVKTVGNRRVSNLAEVLRQEGRPVWDGTDPTIRRDFPRSVDESRIVQYESCRGLEGWVTVLDGFDLFWSSKRDEMLARFNAEQSPGGMQHPAASAAQFAWQWAMIALTRPIDTLVITIRGGDSDVGRLLSNVSAAIPDIVEVVE